MIKKYIHEKFVIVPIYYKVQIYFKHHSNNYQTCWSTQSYIKYELIVSFQFYIRSFIHVSSQKNLDEIFHLNKHKCVKTQFFSKNHSLEKHCVGDLVLKIHLCISQNTKWNEKKKTKPKIIQNVLQKNIIFFYPKCNMIMCFSP
jgi:hypothetical protein